MNYSDDFESNIKSLLASGLSFEGLFSQWPSFVSRFDIPRFLSLYELYKKTIDIPGSIIDLGVYFGSSLFYWNSLAETFNGFDQTRKIIGFDSFQGLKSFTSSDGFSVDEERSLESSFSAPEEMVQFLKHYHNRRNADQFSRIELVVGDANKTIPDFVEKNPGLRISLLHFDFDLYAPTKTALELLYPLLVAGGVVCFDQYGQAPWAGETKAVSEFLESLPVSINLMKHPFTQSPMAYFQKSN